MTNRRPTLRPWIISIAVWAAICSCGSAQQIRWLTDYPAARREAADKRLPMILAVSSDNCIWCRRQEQSTFVDPTVIGVISQQFIALKVDAERDQALAQAMHISQLPTIVVITPDGDLIGAFHGYQEAASLSAQLSKVGAAYISPEWMRRDYEEANKAIAIADYGRAIALLKGIADNGKTLGVQVQARKMLANLEPQVTARLAHAKKQNDCGQTLDAAEALSEVLRAYAGTDAATDGSVLLPRISRKVADKDQDRGQRAKEFLDQARSDLEAKKYLDCLQRCDAIASAFPDLPEGAEAKSMAAAIKADPAKVAQACEALNQRIGALYLTLAEIQLKKGDSAEAQRYLDKVVQFSPTGRLAEQAQNHLSKLQRGSANGPADIKKP